MISATTLLLLALLVLALMTAYDTYRHVAPPLREDTDLDYIAADRFEGCKRGYVFTARNGKLGYYKDRAPANDRNRCTQPE